MGCGVVGAENDFDLDLTGEPTVDYFCNPDGEKTSGKLFGGELLGVEVDGMVIVKVGVLLGKTSWES